jgi:acetyltransferase-like isoleucine patch superfamily enzyme
LTGERDGQSSGRSFENVIPTKPRIPIRDILLFGLWPSRVKVWLYRLKGYRVGKGVSIGMGAVVLGDQVTIGDHTSIGFFTLIRGKEIRLGSHVQIGSMTFLDTPYIEIGEGSKINEQVFVGGLQFPDSRFVMGRNSQIMQMSFLNPSPSITIGDDTGLGGHCLIFGHWSWLSQLEGYTVDFQPVEIGNSVGFAWRVFVAPGTRIGDGSVIGANSLVKGDIPPYSLAAGYPARVISRALDFPKTLSEADRVLLFRNILEDMKRCFTGWGLVAEQKDHRYRFTRTEDSWWGRRKTLSLTLETLDQEPSEDWVNRLEGVDVALSLQELSEVLRERLVAKNIMWIDATKKHQSRNSNQLGDEVSLFLKRYGIRTLRWPLEQ